MITILSDKQTLEMKKTTLKGYLQMKVNEEDWHGVADAAMDLREVEVLLNEIRKSEKYQSSEILKQIDPRANPNIGGGLIQPCIQK